VNYIAERLLVLRKHFNYSQKHVADFLNIDTLTYINYENGNSEADESTLKKLAHLYHLKYDNLISEDDFYLPTIKKHSFLKQLRNSLYRFRYAFLFIFVCAVLLFALSYYYKSLPQRIYNSPSVNIGETFDASQTTVVWLKDGQLQGSGDNSNGQLDISDTDLLKISEGATFTVALHNEGSVSSSGLVKKVAEEISEWEYIISLDAGDGHILALDDQNKLYCAGDNTYGQCSFEDKSNIVKIFALRRGSILVKNDGSLIVAGEFVGSSKIAKLNNVVDIDASDDNTIVLLEDGSVETFSKNKSFTSALAWNDIVQVACGSDFVAGLKKDGTLVIDIDNYVLEEEVSSWSDIIAIAAGEDYLVAYDGEKVYGIGKNAYNQFSEEESVKKTLSRVEEVKVEIVEGNIIVDFSPVIDADSYLISINVGSGMSVKTSETSVTLSSERMMDNQEYTLDITALSDEYGESETNSFNFIYQTPTPSVEPTAEVVESQSPSIVEMPFSLAKLSSMSKKEFEAYFASLEITNISGSVNGTCQKGDKEEMINSVSGVNDYELITLSELKTREIKYTYCEVVVETPTPEVEESQKAEENKDEDKEDSKEEDKEDKEG